MTHKAFVLIETEGGKSKAVLAEISQLEEVISADLVTGPYDAIAIVEGNDLSAIGHLVTTKIHPISGISRTVTCLAV